MAEKKDKKKCCGGKCGCSQNKKGDSCDKEKDCGCKKKKSEKKS